MYQGKDCDIVTVQADSAEELAAKVNQTTARLHVHKIDFTVHHEQGKHVHTAQIIADKKRLLMEG